MQLKDAVSDQDHIQGLKKAPLELVEYGDYQCSSCAQSYLVVKGVQRQLGKKIRFIFRNFPLTEIHPDAFGAAMAAEAAGAQHKFWEMYDLLFKNQLNLSYDDLLNYAEELGLNMNKFGQDIRSASLQAKIEADFEGGTNSGVSGTPAFYINGEKYDGDWENENLLEDLEKILLTAASTVNS
ncbi:MAG: thioredoxin domain-containing protein [Bacteroidota bacterium]